VKKRKRQQGRAKKEKAAKPVKKSACTGEVHALRDSTVSDACCGGCTAKALHLLGFANTYSETVESLNACIAPVYELWAANKCSVQYENVGTPNVCWHSKVVLAAFKQRGQRFVFRKVLREEWTFLLNDTGSCKNYLVEGILNTAFEGRRGTEKTEGTISQLSLPDISSDGSWRHATAVMHGYVIDIDWVWEEHGIMPVKYLWLLPSNKPDSSKGFFKDIYNVYEVACEGKSVGRELLDRVL
jgi:hypothetical protein